MFTTFDPENRIGFVLLHFLWPIKLFSAAVSLRSSQKSITALINYYKLYMNIELRV